MPYSPEELLQLIEPQSNIKSNTKSKIETTKLEPNTPRGTPSPKKSENSSIDGEDGETEDVKTAALLSV